MGKGAVLAAALLFSAFLCPAVGAQFAVPAAKPATSAADDTKAARRHTPATPEETATPTDAKAPRRQAKKIDLGRIDPTKIDLAVGMQADFVKDDQKLPNTWIALGLLELQGGNLAGGKVSLEHAMALGERRGNKAVVAHAARLLGVMHSVSWGFLRGEASGVSMFGGRPDGRVDRRHPRPLRKRQGAVREGHHPPRSLGPQGRHGRQPRCSWERCTARRRTTSRPRRRSSDRWP